MFGRLMPTEGKFFDFFIQHGELCVKGGKELVALMTNFDDLEHRVHAIETIEKQADKVTHSALELLHKTFITPLDREDIHLLITRMDDILDLMQDVAEAVVLYDVRKVTAEATQLGEISQMCCERVKIAVGLLQNLREPASILKTCEEIDRLESDADRVMRSAMSKLFRDESDIKQLIKLRTIYEQLELITDRCEDVANIIEGIVLENS